MADDDAWALDSDEEQEQFTSKTLHQQQRQQQLQPSRPIQSTTSVHPPIRTASTSSVATTSSSFSSSRRHAPPARPHPFPIPPSSSSQNRKTSSSFSSSWTMVDASPAHCASPAAQTLAGSPPTDVGSTAAEAVLQASLRNARRNKYKSLQADSVALGKELSQRFDSSVGMERKKDKELQTFLKAIRPDLPAVVRDPFAALDSLAAEAAEPESATLMTPGATPTTAVRTEREHVQNLGRGFNDLQNGKSPLVSPTSSPPPPTFYATPKAHRTPKMRQESHFDPIIMSGDGIIIGGGVFGSSSTSLDRQGEGGNEGEAVAHFAAVERTPEETANPRLHTASAGLENGPWSPLRRQKSVRTKRRWREFFRCLNAGDAWGDGQGAGVDLPKLRELSWNGIPSELRPIVWPLLLGYMPSQSSTRTATLSRKRAEYCKSVTQAFGYDPFGKNQLDGERVGPAKTISEDIESRPSTPTPQAARTSQASSTAKSDGSMNAEQGISVSGLRMPVLVSTSRRTGPEEKIWHQISIDVPRTNPGLPLWQRKCTQRALERLLYVWALRNHATGYVQGMSDLATPFFEVFLSNYLRSASSPSHGISHNGQASPLVEDPFSDDSISATEMDPQQFDPSFLPLSARIALEADTFWCLSSLLDGIQENYIFAQPGIVRQVRRMEELVARIDYPLHAHLKDEGVEYIQFAFRWMNCLLMREMSVKNVVRLWDTYLAEGPDAFSDFHLYVCSVFLCKWSEQLKGMDFQGCIMFLQSLPTQSWSDKDAELLLSEAFVFKNLFGQTKHLND